MQPYHGSQPKASLLLEGVDTVDTRDPLAVALSDADGYWRFDGVGSGALTVYALDNSTDGLAAAGADGDDDLAASLSGRYADNWCGAAAAGDVAVLIATPPLPAGAGMVVVLMWGPGGDEDADDSYAGVPEDLDLYITCAFCAPRAPFR